MIAKLYKVEMYLIDADDTYKSSDIEYEIEALFYRSEFLPCNIKLQSSNEFEWDDDIDINKIDCPKENFEAYFRKGGSNNVSR